METPQQEAHSAVQTWFISFAEPRGAALLEAWRNKDADRQWGGGDDRVVQFVNRANGRTLHTDTIKRAGRFGL